MTIVKAETAVKDAKCILDGCFSSLPLNRGRQSFCRSDAARSAMVSSVIANNYSPQPDITLFLNGRF